MSQDALMKDMSRRMDGALESLHKDFTGLRTGRASVALLDTIMVDAYGAAMPLNQVGTVTVPESRMLAVQVWDKSMVAAVEKAIRNSGLGLNPSPNGQLVRVPLPPLSEERRVELSKIAGKYSEQGKVSVRNVRRDGMETLKKMEKDGDISQDEMHSCGDEIQKITDAHIKLIDEASAQKEEEIMQV